MKVERGSGGCKEIISARAVARRSLGAAAPLCRRREPRHRWGLACAAASSRCRIRPLGSMRYGPAWGHATPTDRAKQILRTACAPSPLIRGRAGFGRASTDLMMPLPDSDEHVEKRHAQAQEGAAGRRAALRYCSSHGPEIRKREDWNTGRAGAGQARE